MSDTNSAEASAPIDEASETRESERLEPVRLEQWLRANVDGFDGSLAVSQFRKGHSNLTYLVSDGTREWVLRRGPFGSNVATAHDMGREYRILSGLHRAYAPAPRAFALCEDNAVLGAPFYVMERKRGVILRDKPPKGFAWSPELGAATSEAVVHNLAAIHAVDLAAAGLDGFGKPEGYVRRQVEGWTGRYFKAKTDEIEAIERVAEWLAEKLPAREQDAASAAANATLIHNDYKYDNLVFAPSFGAEPPEIIGVLDWEMATVGDPLMDLGTALSYWVTDQDPPEVQMLPFGVTKFPGSWSREQVVAGYAEQSGRDVTAVDFYHVFGLFKTAVVAQQIYYRFKTGKTDDPRFQMMIMGVQVLSGFADRVAAASSL